jgi:hypothetical protein
METATKQTKFQGQVKLALDAAVKAAGGEQAFRIILVPALREALVMRAAADVLLGWQAGSLEDVKTYVRACCEALENGNY